MNKHLPPTDKIRKLLGKLSGYLILRNQDVISHVNSGGDIDLLVEEPLKAEETVRACLGDPLRVTRRSYVSSYYYQWGHVDLYPRVEWRGALLVNTQSLFQEANVTDTGWPKLRLAHEAFICWFLSVLWGGFFKERYRELIEVAVREDAVALRYLLDNAFGAFWGRRLWCEAINSRPETAASWVSTLRRRLWLANFRLQPIRTLLRAVAFAFSELRLRLYPSVPWITVLGPDGSGKSSVVDHCQKRWQSSRIFESIVVQHWRPDLIRPRPQTDKPNSSPHGVPPHNALVSCAKLVFLMLDWWGGYWLRLARLRAKGWLVVFDRHYIDILVDPLRYRYGGPMWLARLVGKFIPRPDLVVILDVPTEVLRRRKQEVPIAETARQSIAYKQLVERLANCYVIDGSRSLADSCSDIERIVFDYMALKTATHKGS